MTTLSAGLGDGRYGELGLKNVVKSACRDKAEHEF